MNSATIVTAALDSSQLETSINALVKMVDEKSKAMAKSFTDEVARMEQAVKNLGKIKIDSGGAADSSISKQTKAQNDATQATDRRVQKEKELNMTLDQGGDILQKVARYASEVRLPDAAKSARESFQAFYKGFNEQARQIEPLIQSWEKLLQARHTGNIEQVAQKIAQVKHEISELVKEQANLSKTKPQGYLDEIAKRNPQIKALREQLISLETEHQKLKASDPFKDNPYLNTLREKLQGVKSAMNDADTTNRRWLQTTQQLTEAQKKSVDEQMKLFYARTMKIPTDQYDMQIVKLERIQSLLQSYRRGEVSFTPAQLSGLEKEERTLSTIVGAHREIYQTQQQVASSTQQTVQYAHQYTEEIKRQAQAIRESAEYKAGKDVLVTTPSGYDAVINIKDRMAIEDKLTEAYQKHIGQKSELDRIEQTDNEVAKERLGTETAITNEISKRRKYSTPETQVGYDVTRDKLAQIIATRNNIERNQVVNWDEQASSIKTLSAALKQYQEAYAKMSATERNSPFGKQMIADMQVLERNIQKFRQQMSRPIDFESVMNLPQKTLDDIAYKMRQLASYRSGLNVDTQKKEIQQVNDEYNRLKKRMDEVMQKNQQMISSNNALGRSWNYMKNRLAFYFTVGASTQFIKNLIEVRSQYEMNERALGILVNSAERGTQIFNELSQMALVSPYTLIELSAAAKQLTAYDVAAKDVVDTTRRLADMAAAVGIPIERLTYALGQIKAYGYLNARDARMFANAGIPLVKQLSEYYTELEGRLVSTADIYDRIKKKSIGYEEVTSVIARMTDEGGKFYDFQAKMAETLKVQLANLTLAWNNMLNAMGEESQGVLVGSISTLKQVFLHWKDIEHVLYELIVAFGAYKAYQIITTRLMGATAASLDAQVLAIKRNNAAMLEKQALTRKLTADELGQVAAQKMVTAADYQNALSGKQLTKQKALLLAAIYKNNVQLKAALVNMGLLTTAEATSITRGKALAIVFKSIGISIKNAALAIRAFAASMWPLLVMGAIYELYHAWDSYGEHVKEVNKQATEHAKEAFENIKQYLESESTINTRQRVVYKEGNPLTDAESQKAWDEMREKIELSSSASNTFIAKLMQIDNINNRLAAGFDYLKDVQRVAGVMQTLEEDAVGVSSTTLGGLFGEGLKDDLVDFINAYQKYISLNENLKQGVVGENYFNEQKKALEEFRGEVEKTTTSLYNIASKEGFNTNEQREFLEREISEIAQAEQMGAKETRIFRMQAEKEYYTYARAQLVAQLEYQDGAQKALTQKRINDLDNEFGKSKALQEGFFTWLTEKQDHAVKNMLRGKTLEEIEQGEWLKGANAKWVEEMARKFSKEYGVSFDDLHKLVLNANTWSINIPVFFQTIGQPLSDVQRDYEARTGKKFSNNPIIKDAKTQVDIIDTLKKKQKEVANEMETARKAGGKYWEDNKQRYKEENDALVADIHAYNALTDAEEKANKKSGKGSSKKDPLLDALKQEISLVEKLQSDYDKLSKSGASQTDALDTIRGAYGKTIRLLNTQLQSYGLPQIDISQLITGKDPNKTLNHFKQTLDTLVSKGMLTLERSKELEAVVEKFTLSAKTYNLDKITKGLNSELDRLKEEYELAVSLDADPELGNAFADMMGIDIESLPHTVKEYADEYSKYLNKYLKGKNSSLQFTGDELHGLTRDDITAFREQVDAGSFNQEWFDAILKAYEDISGKRKKDLEETEKWKNSLIEKYGNLQDKLTKIYKNSVQNQVDAVKTFGTKDQKSDIVRLRLRLEATDNPAELTEINTEIAKIVKDVIDKNPIALKLVTASNNQTKSDTSKAYWEDFKNSELYVMTFEDMANNSTRAIQLIMDKLEALKDKVKEDPASMKALMKSLEDAEKELSTRDPFGEIVRSLRDMSAASQETKAAQEALWRAEVDVEQAQQKVDNAEDWTPEERAIAQQKLTDAVQRRAAAQVKLTQAENKGKKAQENLKSSLQGVSNQLGNVQELFGVVSKLFRAGGDDETADAIDAISEGFSIMTTVIMGVVAAMILLESSQPWLLAIAAALSVIVGLVSFLSGQDNKRIDKKIKESERAVKRLENAYKELEFAAENAFGTAVAGANQAMKANKELQLVELKRQLALEQSRSSKNKDEDKIIDLTGQIIDLENEISKATSETLNNLLGISSHGDFFEDMISDMISAFKNGEDAMKVFEEKWAGMIDNMITKTIVSQVLQNWVNSLENGAQKILDKFTAEPSKAVADLTKQMTDIYSQDASDISEWIYVNDREAFEKILNSLGVTTPNFDKGPIFRSAWFDEALNSGLAQKIADAYKNMLGGRMDTLSKNLDKASLDATGDLIDYYSMAGEDFKENYLGLILDKIQENWNFGQDSETQLSSLQQGIQGITEDTAGALEAITNGISQQCYLQSDLLTQIRDAVFAFDLDVNVATMSQILLQLQSSYTVQMSIQGILEGWNNPSGQAVRVELVS